MSYFTRKGDAGTTALFNCPHGTRLSKGEDVFEILGALDELNCMTGLCRSVAKGTRFSKRTAKGRDGFLRALFVIQEDLFIIQAEIAGAAPRLFKEKVDALERATEYFAGLFPVVRSFVVPGATALGAQLDITRAVARKAERVFVRREQKRKINSPVIGAYLNRLSSLLYCLARYANYAQGASEESPSYK